MKIDRAINYYAQSIPKPDMVVVEMVEIDRAFGIDYWIFTWKLTLNKGNRDRDFPCRTRNLISHPEVD